MQKLDFLRMIFMMTLLLFDHSNGEEEWKGRMSALEHRVEELESEAVTRNELIRLFSQSVTQLTYKGSDNSGKDDTEGKEDNEDEENTEDQGIAPVTIKEVRRERMGDKTKFTVKYKQEVDDLTVSWYDQTSNNHLDDYTDMSLGDGNRETSVLVSSEEDMMDYEKDNYTVHVYQSPVFVVFDSSNGRWANLIMSKKGGDAVETDIVFPVLKVEPAGDLVYEEGQDILFKVMTPPLSDGPSGIGHFQSHFTVLDLDTLKLEMVDRFSKYVELMGNESYPDYHEWDVKLQTAEEKVSGIISLLIMDQKESEEALVEYFGVGMNIIVRPSTQDGPFPSGYIAFISEPWITEVKLDDGTSAQQEVCRRDMSGGCTFSCLAVGEDITNVEVYKVESDGTTTPVSGLSRFSLAEFPELNDYQRRAIVKISTDNTEDLDRERFRCIATNTIGSMATIDVVTEYFTEPRILPEETGIQILNPNEASTVLDIKVVCKVRGKPEPNVTFTIETLKSYDFSIVPDEVFDEGNDVYSAAKYLTYDPSDRYGYNSEHSGMLQSASCDAQNGPPFYGYDYYSIPIPAELQE